MLTRLFGGLMISAVLVMAFSSVGCNQPAKEDDNKQAKNTDDKKKGDGKKDVTVHVLFFDGQALTTTA